MVEKIKKKLQEFEYSNGLWFNAFIFLAVFLILFFIWFVITYKIDLFAIIYSLKDYGLIGLFVGSIISNASIFLVVPIDAVVFVLGEVYHPIVLGLVVGIGAAIGELTAYILGLGGHKVLKKIESLPLDELVDVVSQIEKKGFIFIIFAAFTPFPFDLVGIACGLIRYDIFKFFVASFIGKFFRFFVIAYAGIFGIEIVRILFGF